MEYEMRYIDDFGDVGCGKVVEFAPRPRKVAAVLPRNAPSDDQLATFTVSGPSLSGRGIYDGDTLICRRAYKEREIDRNTICVVRIISTGEIVAKTVWFKEGMVTLCSSGGNVPDVHHRPEDIEIQGVVFAVQKPLLPSGRVRTSVDDEIGF